jgi:hypothetical protein
LIRGVRGVDAGPSAAKTGSQQHCEPEAKNVIAHDETFDGTWPFERYELMPTARSSRYWATRHRLSRI